MFLPHPRLLRLLVAAWLCGSALPLVSRAQPYGLSHAEAAGPYLNGALPPLAPNISAAWMTEVAFTNLTVSQPIFLLQHPTTNHLLVVRKPGQIVQFENRRNVSNSEASVFLDLQSRVFTVSDSGMTALTFHPQFGSPGSTNRGFVYVTYKWRPSPAGGANPDYAYWRLSRFTVPDGQLAADPNSELVMIQQLDRQMWHDAGCLLFGPDGYLYFSVGDEGGGNDQYNDTQHINDRLFSGIFRVDVDQDPARSHPVRRQPQRHADTPPSWPDPFTTNYFIPNDNPFLDLNGGVLEEFYALGFRNPYRFSLDPVTGRIWIGETGQSSREEVDILQAGANYQWAYREGFGPGPKTPPANIIGVEKEPIWDYGRSYGGSLIGGHVYRGTEHAPQLTGKYICADNVSGRISALDYDGTNLISAEHIATMPSGSVYGGTSSCGLDANGEIYFLKFGDEGGGQIFKLARILTTIPDPTNVLSGLGAFTNLATLAPAPALVPYTVNTPLWSDNAAKSRWLVVPNDGTLDSPGEQITFSPTNDWLFPTGTVFVKHFELPVDDRNPAIKRRLETRFLVVDETRGVYGLTYKWRPDGLEADLLTNGVTTDYVITNLNSTTRTQTWQFPSRQDCLTCHNANANRVLGLKTHQLNCDLSYPQTGVSDNQLRALGHIGLLAPPFEEAAIGTYLKSHSATNPTVPPVTRVRSYIDANCSQCHRPGGVRANFDARYITPLSQQHLIYGPLDGFINGPQDRVVRPGDVLHSLLHNRPNRVGQFQMPPLAKNVVDTQAVAVIAEWINSLSPGPEAQLSLPNPDQSAVAGAFIVQAAFSTSVNGLTPSDFTIHNGTALSLVGAEQNFTLLVQPQSAGPVTVRLPSDSVTDGNGDINYESNLLTVQHDPLAASLLTWLPLDDGTGLAAADVSVHDNNGALNNFAASPWVAGQTGGAIDFDGTNDYVAINNIVSSNFTLACWIKTTQTFPLTTATFNGAGILWSDVGGAAADFVLGGTRGSNGVNRLSFFTGNGPDGPDVSINGITPINTGEWTHLAVTRNGASGQCRLYVNGILDNTGTGGTALLTANPEIHIGGNTLDSHYFQGQIDDVRIYSRVLNATEINSLVPLTPVAWYRLEGDGLDSSGHAQHGTPTNLTYGASRVNASAAQFNGTNSFVQVPLSISNHFSIAFWVKTSDTGGAGQWFSGKGLVDAEVSGGTTDFGTALVGSKAAFGVGNTNTTILSATSINNGQWHHVAATRNSTNGQMRLYVDGVLEAGTNGPTGLRLAPPALRLGGIQTGVPTGFLSGALDDVQLFDFVLTANQVAALAGQNTPPLLAPISNRTLIAGATLVVTNSAADFNTPAQTLTYSLAQSPTGAAINPTNGTITWRPAIAQSPSTNILIVQVADNGTPALNTLQSFTATVLQPARPVLAPLPSIPGAFRLTITGDSGPDYLIYASTNLTSWALLLQTNPPALPFLFLDPAVTNLGRRFYQIQLGP